MARNSTLPLMIRLRQELNAPAETPAPAEVVDEKARDGLSMLKEKIDSLLEVIERLEERVRFVENKPQPELPVPVVKTEVVEKIVEPVIKEVVHTKEVVKEQEKVDLSPFVTREELDELTEALKTGLSKQTVNIGSMRDRHELKVVTADVTANDGDLLVCRNSSPVTVTLYPTPRANSIVEIKRTDGEVRVVGTIDGASEKILNVNKYNMKLVYDARGKEWIEI